MSSIVRPSIAGSHALHLPAAGERAVGGVHQHRGGEQDEDETGVGVEEQISAVARKARTTPEAV